MKFRSKILGALLALTPSLAFAAGYVTNGVPTVPTPSTYPYPQIMGNELLPADTQLPSGQVPQSVAPTAAQVALAATCAAANPGTISSNALTLNTQCGLLTTDALAMAPGATYTATITNSLVSATSTIYAGTWLKSATAGRVQIVSITPGAGSFVVVIKNSSATATLNGTGVISFFIL